MNFFKIFFIIIFSLIANAAFADNHDQKQEVLDAAKEIVKEMEEDEEVPLNDPFAGNEGTSSSTSIPQDEQDNEMSSFHYLAHLVVCLLKMKFPHFLQMDRLMELLHLPPFL